MASNKKVAPVPCPPKGLIALARASGTSVPPGDPKKPAAPAEPPEQTRHFRPDRTLLEPPPQVESASSFADAADEQTMIGVVNLRDPRVFRSEPPPPAPIENGETEATTIEFVGAVSGFGEEKAGLPVTERAWLSDEKTTLYRPQRMHLPEEEHTEEFELEPTDDEHFSGPVPPKVIVAAEVLAGLPLHPGRTEQTKKRRGRGRVGGKLGVALCLCGGLALALCAAWRYPGAMPMARGALVRVATVVAGR